MEAQRLNKEAGKKREGEGSVGYGETFPTLKVKGKEAPGWLSPLSA